MEEKPDEKIVGKLRKASQLLFFKQHRLPGVKGWELKKSVGKDYLEVLKVLDSQLDKLDLRIKSVKEEGETPDEARYMITAKTPLKKGMGWRIDDVAALAASTAYIISKHGKASRKEVEELLRTKFPKWRVEINIDRFIRQGYLSEDKDGMLFLDWRARAEIDQKTLVGLILSS